MSYEVPDSVPIPSDVERPDKILAGLTARQVAIAAVAAAVIWAGFQATRHVMPLPAFAALASPAGLAAAALVIGERDGLSLDRLLMAAWRQRRAPRRLVTAPEGIPGPARLDRPARPAAAAPGGARAAVAARRARRGDRPGQRRRRCRGGGVHGQLRAAQPRRAGRPRRRLRPVAELAHRPGADPGPGRAGRPVRRRRGAARRRPRPAAPGPGTGRPGARRVPGGPGRRAGRAHPPGAADLREPGHGSGRPGGTAAGRALQRAGEAARLLAGAGLQVQVLDGGQVTALLAACADPAAPPQPAGRTALPGRPVTRAGRPA